MSRRLSVRISDAMYEATCEVAPRIGAVTPQGRPVPAMVVKASLRAYLNKNGWKTRDLDVVDGTEGSVFAEAGESNDSGAPFQGESA